MRKYVSGLLVLSLCLCMGCFCSRKQQWKRRDFKKKKKKKGFCCSISQTIFPVPSPKWTLLFMTLISLFPPQLIQHSGLQPLISACSPASITRTPPFFPRGWVLVWELLFPLGCSSWQPICKILWPKGSCSPETAMLILLCGAGTNSE